MKLIDLLGKLFKVKGSRPSRLTPEQRALRKFKNARRYEQVKLQRQRRKGNDYRIKCVIKGRGKKSKKTPKGYQTVSTVSEGSDEGQG